MAQTTTVSIPVGGLVLLSGAPGAGKSSACEDLPPQLVVSSDDLRHRFFGTAPAMVDGQVGQRPLATDDGLIFSTLENLVKSRLKVGLTTVVDATLLTDRDRKPLAKLADQFGAPCQVIIFNLPLEQLQRQNRQRPNAVPAAVVEAFHQRLETSSQWPYTLISQPVSLTVDIPTIPDVVELDVIGDVHGLKETLLALLERLGYDRHLDHPQGRRLCFLGDLVDRGPQSLEVLDLAMAAVAKGHYCLRGNHDHNLARGLRGETVGSRSTQKTLHQLLRREPSYQRQIQTFIQTRPTFYRYRHYLLCHGDVDWFDPLLQPAKDHLYGCRKFRENYDTDAVFRQTSELTLVRGHIPATSPGRRTHSLEAGAGFGGPMVGLRLPAEKRYEQPCEFDYSRLPPSFGKQMHSLTGQKLVRQVSRGHFTLFHYTQKALASPESWQQFPILHQARGTVMGLGHEPINRPFPPIPHYLAAPTLLKPQAKVIAVEQLSGALMSVCLSPYDRQQLVIAGLKSFNIDLRHRRLLNHQGLCDRILTWLQAHPNITLLWTAVAPQTPQAITYPHQLPGLYLVGAGTLGQGFMEEAALDQLALELAVKRPRWFAAYFSEALQQVRTVAHEGFILRRADSGDFALQLKSPYYLRTQLLARLTPGRTRLMFEHPPGFKRQIDNACWPLVNWLTEHSSLEVWQHLSSIQQIDMLQTWLEARYSAC